MMLALMDGLRRDIADIRHPARSVVDDEADQRVRALAERLAESPVVSPVESPVDGRADPRAQKTAGLSLLDDDRRHRR